MWYILAVVGLLLLLLLLRARQKEVELRRRQWIDEVLTKAINTSVASLMGRASTMKRHNDGYLTTEERDGLRDYAMQTAVCAASSIAGEDITVYYTFEDMEARIAAAVRRCKLQWNTLDELYSMAEFMHGMMENSATDDDDGDEWKKA